MLSYFPRFILPGHRNRVVLSGMAENKDRGSTAEEDNGGIIDHNGNNGK